MSRVVDNWADGWTRAPAADAGSRFSALAPGLLTAFGETQHPDDAVDLFDRLVETQDPDGPVITRAANEGPGRNALVDALGCFGKVIRPLTETSHGAGRMLAVTTEAAPNNGEGVGQA